MSSTSAVWTRECQECGHKQKAKKPDATKPMTDSYANSKCRKCKSMGLDHGRMMSEVEELSWAGWED